MSFYFLKIPMDRMPPRRVCAPLATHTHTHIRTCDHTNPRGWLVKNVWVARTGGKRKREESLGRRKKLGKSKKERRKKEG